jgi:hypothetical protein
MYIDPLRPKAAPAGASRTRDAAPGFTPQGVEEAAPSARAAPTAAPSLDAILALQGDLPDPERRRRQMLRAGRTLDGLDRLQIALLGGGSLDAADQELRNEPASLEDTGDAGLDLVLSEIETRRAVELAKLEMRRRAAAQAVA